MAVANMVSSQLRLVLLDGENLETGKPVYKFKSFSNIKVNANADQLHAVALAFAGLQERDLYTIERNDSSQIQ